MGKHTTEMKMVETSKLIPYVNNARTHSQEQVNKLRGSLREFGFINPVIIDKELNVIAGHGRIAAAKEEGYLEIPCVFVEHLTDTQKKAYILADNRMALDAGWDDELLAVEMEELQNLGFDLGLTGFDEKEIADLVEVYLKNENYNVYKFYNSNEAIKCIENVKLDLAILDVMIAGVDGFELCKLIRDRNLNFPIIMLTAKI